MHSNIPSYYGELTFNKDVMKSKLSKEVFKSLRASIESHTPLDASIVDSVAHAMKEWAIDNGATHFTHWFQPQRGGTAEKHDAFITYGSEGEIIERFSSSQLIQSEPDASSFPSGGMRTTFEARGYTAWDPSSPAFLLESKNSKTLVIPSVFLSWTGNVLDLKTPMLRSQKALNDAVIRVQKLLGNRSAKNITVYVGPEQEYFLFSKELVESRPDLKVCDRTLFGAAPAKGQQMDDHYFGAIKDKVLDYMEELDYELYRRGIPAKTRHNEVSPNQFEIAPLYETSNTGIDHNLQMMNLMRELADEHGFVVGLHEKPLAGVNGSGKHLNWSIADNTGTNYLEPSASPLKNITFLITSAAIMHGLNEFGGLLRASVANAGNDHRLGANEAPPAIMSIYYGEYLNGIFETIEGLGTKVSEKVMSEINLGVKNLPTVAKDISDRNRTSPVAFTGNKFEFRAVGSSQNCSESATIMNLMVAYGYDYIYSKLEGKKGDKKANALLVIKDILKKTKRIRFEGNNYSEEWKKEAEKRGLPNAVNTPAALELMLEKKAVKLFTDYGVLSAEEVESKVEIQLEAYNNVKDIEFRTAINIAQTLALPALVAQIANVGGAIQAMKGCGVKPDGLTAELKELNKLYTGIRKAIAALEASLTKIGKMTDLHKQAHAMAGDGANKLAALRTLVDEAEEMVADELWPMAKYQELLTVL